MLGRMFSRWAFITLLLAAGLSATAQTRTPGVFDLDKDREPMVVLDGTWRFHAGDDARWAEPGFDDSRWSVLKGDRDWDSRFDGLFGFHRTRHISTQSAEAIAATAQAHGQEDDITVLTLTFAPAEVLA